MRVEPDAQEAVHERTQVLRRLRRVLERAELTPPEPDTLRHPAAAEVAHLAQHALRSGPLAPERQSRLAARLGQVPPAAFGPADPQDHLNRSVTRALRAIPERKGADGQPVTAVLTVWDERERAALTSALGLLGRVWPEAAAEVRETVTEIALLDGEAIDGFTDFTVHGAVLVHRARLTDSAAGLPGPVRFAEALVHEGTHTRCNAAALTAPFLAPDDAPGDAPSDQPRDADGTGRVRELLVETPLRADPRPLTGLFQQTVVLARSVELYRRLTGLGPAVDSRRATLLRGAHQAVDTLGTHAGRLTDHGKELLAECDGLIGAAA
ncbi:HEXXH motif-containing putative peptide modification protein [Streptomyces sp. DSM 41014]|uniref:HEXXH motif-containing putative peptide modification protein n=1 Tax=Streptomyces hintoniae TaxID=3075521 RepID=A0ABU2UJF0_9ACTN|nr:HEXXH motif-containing putative peptide modification protein [Streptomyces sp. DSM 41014]MDT0473293.1 HEXXH motif-containing putative peptide modification protein [Streptomyces sp. DSM 41014]